MNAIDVERKCSKCKLPIGPRNKTGICTRCQKPARYAKKTDDDSVLARAGFGSLVPKKPALAPPKAKPKTLVVRTLRAEGPNWQQQFHTLATALGLDPETMLEKHCRDWVENTRARALPTAPVPA